MKSKYLLTLLLCCLLSACNNGNDGNVSVDRAIKEKELELKAKELDLKAQELAQNKSISKQSAKKSDALTPSNERNITVLNAVHPTSEPKGLIVVNFSLDGNKSYSYRIYCPTKMVRNVSNNQWGKDKHYIDEDATAFGGYPVLSGVIEQSCR